MTDDQIVELGVFCQSTLVHDHFNEVWRLFEQQTTANFLSTKPEQAAEREAIYAKLNGARELLGFMHSIVLRAEELTAAAQPTTDLQDDPEVHDIYREID